LALFPIPFMGPDVLQQIYGRLPELIQMVMPFILSGFVAVSAVVLTVKASRRELWWHAFVSFSCLAFGALAIAYAAVVMVALGSGTGLVAGVAMAGLVVGAGMVVIEQRRGMRTSA